VVVLDDEALIVLQSCAVGSGSDLQQEFVKNAHIVLEDIDRKGLRMFVQMNWQSLISRLYASEKHPIQYIYRTVINEIEGFHFRTAYHIQSFSRRKLEAPMH
jgi:hypothetical protein